MRAAGAPAAEVSPAEVSPSAPDASLDRLAFLAANLLDAPMAAVSLIQADRVTWAASSGTDAGTVRGLEHPLAGSVCQLVRDGGLVLFPDASVDPRLASHPLVTRHDVRGWAAAPVLDGAGRTLGALSVLDTSARCWSTHDGEALTALAQAVSAELAVRAASLREQQARAEADFRATVLRVSSEATLDGILVVSPEGRMLSWNSRFHALWEIPEEVVRGGSDEAALASVLDKVADPEAFLARVHALYLSPVPAQDEIRMLDGRVLDRYGTPLHGEDGTYYGYAWYVRDVSVQRHATEALEASEARYRSLVQALTSEVWYADPGGALVSDMPSWRSVTGQSREDLLGNGWVEGIHPDDRRAARAAWEEAVHGGLRYTTEYRIRPVRGSAESQQAGTRVLEVRGVPIEHEGRVVEWVGVYLDVTELRAAEAARERLAAYASSAAERTRTLQEVTAALSGAVTVGDVLTVILEHAQAGLGATSSGVALRDGDEVFYQVLNGYSADIKAQWSRWSLDADSPVTYVMRHRRPLFLESSGELFALFDNESMRAFVEVSGEQSWARLPLLASTGPIGALVFGFEQPRRFSIDERSFLSALAGQCAQAIERAQLYDRERNTARLLQRSLLPDALPAVPGVQLGASCQPASNDVEVGGDWFDALVMPDGRLVVAVGDVMGKGVRAASVMGQVRNALRGVVHADTSPAAVLAWLDAVVVALDDDEELVTLAYGVLDPATGVFEWGCAGHPPPLLLGPSGVAFLEGGESLPLGLSGPRSSARVQLGAGEALMMFSDGLVESRTRPLVDGLELLCGWARRLAGSTLLPAAGAIVENVVTDMVELSNDDVTVLVLRRDTQVTGGAARHPVASISLPARATSASTARRFVTGQLEAWDAGSVLDAVLLGVSEVVTNAVVHAHSRAELGLSLSEGVLRVEVRDFGPTPIPSARRPATAEDTHGRGLMLVQAVTDRWGMSDEPEGKVVWFELAL